MRAREDATVSSVNRRLAENCYDIMTVDEVAADVGIAKASQCKHFTSKEVLAGGLANFFRNELPQLEGFLGEQRPPDQPRSPPPRAAGLRSW